MITQATESLPEPLKTEVREIDRRLSKVKIEPIEKRLKRAKMMTQNRIIRTLLEETRYQVITASEAKGIEFEKLAELLSQSPYPDLAQQTLDLFKKTYPQYRQMGITPPPQPKELQQGIMNQHSKMSASCDLRQC